MGRRLAAFAVLAAVALTVAGSALAFDCIRVSASLQGLQQSTKSGNWLLFDLSTPAGVATTFENVTGGSVPDEVAACVAEEYAATGERPFFALGTGVAGGKKDTNPGGFGVLAWHNKNEGVLSNVKGIDHLESSPVGAALFGSLEACGIDVSEG
jgi:hypothetical protein